jgi:ATP phosphoribosyltransferase regulatory subunit HisZ
VSIFVDFFDMFAVYVDRIDTSVNQLGKYGYCRRHKQRMLFLAGFALEFGTG